jgi:geranylgeranyl pyrophosphate synthase
MASSGDFCCLRSLPDIASRFGYAFQIQDDINDFTDDAVASGKDVLNDIKTGNYTLPLIYAIQNDDGILSDIASGDFESVRVKVCELGVPVAMAEIGCVTQAINLDKLSKLL